MVLPWAELWQTASQAVLSDALGAVLIATAIVSLFVIAELLKRNTGLSVELTRKLTHVGAGAVVLTFPWALDSTWTVGVLALAFLGVLVGGRLTGLLSSVHDIDRRTGGAYLYPFAVLGTFWLADGDALLFCAPMAVMAIADTGAALVGKRAGTVHYAVMDGHRSLEGSLTFFGLALAVFVGALALAGRPGWPEMLLVCLVAAIITTATEAISVAGVDNLFIPYAGYLVLDRTLRLGLRDLSGWIEGMILSLALLVLTSKRAALTPAGGLTVFLLGTVVWALGGWQWMVPLLALYLLFTVSAPVGRPQDGTAGTDIDEVFPSTVGSIVVVLAFAHANDSVLFLPYVTTLGANGAIAMLRLSAMRRWPATPLVIGGLLGPMLPVLAWRPDTPLLLMCGAGLVGVAAWWLLSRTSMVGRRGVASLLAGAIVWSVLG